VANLLAGVQAEAWSAVEPATLAGIAPSERPPVVDLRPAAAYNDGHIEGAVNIPLAILVGQIDRIPTGGPVILVDETGYHSAVAFAALRLLGYSDVRHVAGGMAGWRAEGLPEAAVLRHLTWRRCAPARAIPIG
jgi:rhodanese-related sulfurtransferase